MMCFTTPADLQPDAFMGAWQQHEQEHVATASADEARAFVRSRYPHMSVSMRRDGAITVRQAASGERVVLTRNADRYRARQDTGGRCKQLLEE